MKLKTFTLAMASLASLGLAGSALAQKKYDTGAND